jgi:hypothetical protein
VSGNLVRRTLISRIEIILGVALLLLIAGHVGWCRWSIPRHGIKTAHGIETAACNWGTSLFDITLGFIAVLTIVSGAVSYFARLRRVPWWVAQLPALVAWGWLVHGFIFAFFFSS